VLSPGNTVMIQHRIYAQLYLSLSTQVREFHNLGTRVSKP
jgi:hypothetical protein